MASSLIVLNNSLSSQLAETNSDTNLTNNTTENSSNKQNETTLINVTSRVSSASSNSSKNNAGILNNNNNNQSVVTIINNDRSNSNTSLPSLSLSSPKYTEKNTTNEENANQKIYISTHHLKMSNKESNASTNVNGTNIDSKKISIVNNTRGNSAKIKIKYKHNLMNSLPSSTPPPLFSPLHSPNSLTNSNGKRFSSNDMDMPISPSSSSPSSPSSLISSPSDSSNSPLPNLILSQSSLINDNHNSLNTGFLDEEQASGSNKMVIESNKLHLSINKPNVIRTSSFISEKVSRPTEHSHDHENPEKSNSTSPDRNQNDDTNENSSSSTDSNHSNEKYLTSDFCAVKSPIINQREKSALSTGSAKPIKTKKRVSFNDSLVQVHLIPNVSNISNVEKYKYYIKTPTLAATMITASASSDIESDAYYQVNYQLEAKGYKALNSTKELKDPVKKVNENNNSDFNMTENHNSENDENNHSQPGNNSPQIQQENLPSLNDSLITKGILTNGKSLKTPTSSILKRTDSPTLTQDLKKNTRNHHLNNHQSIPNRIAILPINLAINSEFFNSTNSSNYKHSNENGNNNPLTIIGNSSNPRSHLKRETSCIIAPKNPNQAYTNQRSLSSLSNNTTNISPQFILNVNPYHHHHQQQQQQQQEQITQSQSVPQQNATFSVYPASYTSINLNDTSKLNEQTNNQSNFAHPKPPKYLSSNLRVMSASSNNSNISSIKNDSKLSKTINNKSNYKMEPNYELNVMSVSNNGNNISGQNIITEVAPQLKVISNLKKLKSSPSCSPLGLSSNETTNDINVNFENIENVNINNTPPVIIKNSSAKNSPTKYIFLKSDEKLQQNLNESISMNRSNTLSNLKNDNFNSASFASDLSKNTNNSDFKNSLINGDYITSLASYNSNNSSNSNIINGTNSNNNTNAKNIAMSTVNQLVALKDVNYYLTNSSKHPKKLNGQVPISYSQTSSYSNSKPPISINQQNVNNQVTEIKLRSNNIMSESDFRRTHSALPLLRNGIKLANGNTNGNTNGHHAMNNNNNNGGNPGDLKNGIKGINTTISYKLVNSPMINSLTRAKSFLYNQNATTNAIDRRLRGGSIEKTSL